jgi:hypothetical protein
MGSSKQNLGCVAGATLRELMDRMGHSSTRAALIYQHRTTVRDQMIADAISERAVAERDRARNGHELPEPHSGLEPESGDHVRELGRN